MLGKGTGNLGPLISPQHTLWNVLQPPTHSQHTHHTCRHHSCAPHSLLLLKRDKGLPKGSSVTRTTVSSSCVKAGATVSHLLFEGWIPAEPLWFGFLFVHAGLPRASPRSWQQVPAEQLLSKCSWHRQGHVLLASGFHQSETSSLRSPPALPGFGRGGGEEEHDHGEGFKEKAGRSDDSWKEAVGQGALHMV